MLEQINRQILRHLAMHYDDEFSQAYLRNVVIDYDYPDVTIRCSRGEWSVECMVNNASFDDDLFTAFDATISDSLGYFGGCYADGVYDEDN